MGVFLYNIFLLLFRVSVRIASLFHTKARKWLNGRKDIFRKLEQSIPADGKIIWMHCASLGEFEQGRPVLEKIRQQYPGYRLLLTFFSPSGYEARQNYKGADWVFYLPPDGPRNARRFLEIVHPSLVIFVKYEFWYYYLKKIKYRGIPLLLVSAIFHKDMHFFQWYGSLMRKMLSRFDHLFVQTEDSRQLLETIGLEKICTVSGDTRFDRVLEIAETAASIPLVQEFAGGQKLLVAGSTWAEDETMLSKGMAFLQSRGIKLVIAPHEVDPGNISSLEEKFPGAVRYSALAAATNKSNHPVLIIDNIGMLSALYRYSWCSYVGGGLSKGGVHNVLEAAVYGRPVLYGSNYQKYAEAVGLINREGAMEIRDLSGLEKGISRLLDDAGYYEAVSKNAAVFVQDHAGASRKILSYIQEKRLLTS